ncbi:MAG TPA: hypothetical protein PLA46_02495 [Phycicoccus sp.]|nr:hypothetical protein [Phycicoccus sp.]
MGEPVSLLSFFLSAAGAFGKLTGWLVKHREADREKVAGYFDEVSACLREVAQRIEDGEAPRDTCRRLAVYAQELQHILGDRGYLTAAGDASIDETRLRLAGELEQAQVLWDRVLVADADPIDLASATLSRELVYAAEMAKIRPGTSDARLGVAPDEATVDRLERELIDRGAFSAQERVQPIWDAAGEFSALADALRAR